MTDRITATEVKQLAADVLHDDPIVLTDDELVLLAYCAARELRSRLPRYAVELGDLPESDLPAVEAREQLLEAVETFRKDQ